ncbi:MAG: ATPase P [Lachnospiraceae bacterium]|nr:ATPase P [Lachnospiraceae bacterium]
MIKGQENILPCSVYGNHEEAAMLMPCSPLGNYTLPKEALAADRAAVKKFGPCGAGEKALYIGSKYISRRYYIPWGEVRRVFKRVAMSAGGFTGKGIFGSMAYIVVQFGNGKEKDCYFKMENELDALLSLIEKEHPEIPTHSAAAERKLAAAAAERKKQRSVTISAEAEETAAYLERAEAFLDQEPSVSQNLTIAAKQKRIVDNMKPQMIAIGTIVGIAGILAAVYGAYGLLTGSSTAMYFLLGGGVLFFFVFSANLFPGKYNSRKYADSVWNEAVEKSRKYISSWAEPFPVPAQYAHVLVLERMRRAVRDGRADDAGPALEIVKSDLRALNSSVTVSQEEHDEVVEIKPLFLVCDYKD